MESPEEKEELLPIPPPPNEESAAPVLELLDAGSSDFLLPDGVAPPLRLWPPPPVPAVEAAEVPLPEELKAGFRCSFSGGVPFTPPPASW